ncbi:FAD-binding protein [Symbiopectobacterium sp. Eva_TO]
MFEGDSVEALATAIKIDPKQLSAMLAAYTGYAKAKKDTEFGRESFKQALDTGKYYAIEVTPGIHHTMGGIAINSKAQVIDNQGKVIPNLFAAGEAAGGVHGANRLGGNSLADIVTFGRIGADEAVKEIKAGK